MAANPTDDTSEATRITSSPLTTGDLARRAGVQKETVLRAIRNGRLRASRVVGLPGNHVYLIMPEDAAQFIAARRQRPQAHLDRLWRQTRT
jgi:excisionase family DNA binding protein